MGSKVYFFLAAIIFSNIACISWIDRVVPPQQINQEIAKPLEKGFGNDIGHTWPTEHLPAIAMPIEDTLRYQLDSTGNLEWEALLPNGGIINVGSQRKPYTISMFHQLRCLDILCRYITGLDWPHNHSASTLPPDEKHDLAQHCLAYLHQMIVCRADTALEGIAGEDGKSPVIRFTRCKDWRVVYDALRRNNME